MSSWLRAAGRAAIHAARRADLWPAGALAEIVPLAWLPLAVAVVSVPSLSELTFAGVEFATAPALALRIAAVTSVALGVLLLVRLLSAFGEAAVTRGSASGSGRSAPRAVAADAGAFVVIEVTAFIPALLAGAALVFAAANAAPRVWQRPDIAGVDAVGRLASAVAPLLLLFVAAVVVGHVVAAAARVALIAHPSSGAREVVRAAWRSISGRPLAAVGVSVVMLIVRLAFILAASVLLRLAWSPIGYRIGDSDPWAPATLPLLIGFVFAWFCIVAASGALHVWLVDWWLATFDDGILHTGRARNRGARWTPEHSSS